MKRTKNNLNKITADYRSKRIQHPLAINNIRFSKYIKEFQAPQKLWTTKKDRQNKIHVVGNGLHFVSYDNDYDNEYDIKLNKTVRQLTVYRVEKMMEKI
jgi:hypothetical protein